MAKGKGRTGKSVRALLRVPRDRTVALTDFDAGATPGIDSDTAAKTHPRDAARLHELQERLHAENRRSLLVVLQGMDTSGKDGTIEHVIGEVDPHGVHIKGFKAPTKDELRHDFLWRIRKELPMPGMIGIFARSHYEDVLVVRVHDLVPKRVWSKRYDVINDFEREVSGSGTTIVKVFLNLSFEEQARRLIARLEDPTKRWKYDPGDIDERGRWAEYMAAYGEALSRCNTTYAPWYVVPADKKWYRNWAVTQLLIETLEEIDPRYPPPTYDVVAELARMKRSAKEKAPTPS